MAAADVGGLSVGVLKAILFENHVPLGPGVREKGELVERVQILIETERHERQMQRLREEEEEWEREEAARWREEHRSTVEDAETETDASGESDDVISVAEDGPILEERVGRSPAARSPPETPTRVDARTPEPGAARATPSAAKPKKAPVPPPPTFAERSGLCVICQDEDANIVIVDCG